MRHELYRKKDEVKKWLKKYNIKDYILIENKEYGYIVDVDSHVNLFMMEIRKIKVKFNIIKGDFNCRANNLNSLYGCPKEVKGSFYCSDNQLKTLEGCPEIIHGIFHCSFNQLKTLKYFPQEVKQGCNLECNSELCEIQEISNFEELKKIHDAILLNKQLEKEISIDNDIKNVKIKI